MVIDLYDDKLHNDRDDLIKKYQDLITWSTHIYIVSPVWWFRLTPKLETFFDQVLTPGFAYKFVNITKLYAFPKPLPAPVTTTVLFSKLIPLNFRSPHTLIQSHHYTYQQ